MAGPSPFAALARFHLHVGAQLALRAGAPLSGVPVLLILVQQDPGAALRAAASWLLGPSGGRDAGLAIALVALTLAGWAAPRVTAGLAGWARHLPASQATHRRAALVALATAQAPLYVALLALVPLAARGPGGLLPARLAALPLTAAAAAFGAWPGEGSWRSRAPAVAALVLLLDPGLASLVGAALLLVAADRFTGPLTSAKPGRRAFRGLPTPALVTTRALGLTLVTAPLLSLLPVGAMTLLRVNNDLTPGAAAGAARFGGGLGVVLLLATLAERLAERRPVWPWARSLPVGSLRRTGEDALVLAAVALVPIAATAVLDPLAALAVGASLPFLAFRAVGATRAGTRPRTGAAALPSVEGWLLAGGVTLLPWLAVLALLATPLAWRAAAERDRRLKVSRWDELHHRAVGDPLSWSTR
jgi:hypothetical protein